MPIYEYQASDETKGCDRCRNGFELMQKMSDPVLTQCPCCGVPVTKLISAHSVGASRSGLDQRAKNADFQSSSRVTEVVVDEVPGPINRASIIIITRLSTTTITPMPFTVMMLSI